MPVCGTWEVKVKIMPPKVTEEGRGPTGQRKECGFYTKCTKWSLECFEQKNNAVGYSLSEDSTVAERIDYEGNRGRNTSQEAS